MKSPENRESPNASEKKPVKQPNVKALGKIALSGVIKKK